MTNNRTLEDYNKKYELLDANTKVDYEGFMKTCSDFLESVESFLASTKVSWGTEKNDDIF